MVTLVVAKMINLANIWSVVICRSHIMYTFRPVARGAFEGVRTSPPCSLSKFIFNETAAVQGTIIQPCSGIVTDGIQTIMQLLQGVVTYMSPVEAFATGIKNFDWW